MKFRCHAEGVDGEVAVTVSSNIVDGQERRRRREIRLGIFGPDQTVIVEHKAEIVARLRLLYCVIERLHRTRSEFSLDDIVADFRKALNADKEIAETETDFPIRADLVSVGREFRACFEYVYLSKISSPGSLSDYIDAQVRALKEKRKVSRARAFESTHKRLKEFSGCNNLPFGDIDKAFIAKFARWLSEGAMAPSTQSFYLSTLRSILNHARAEDLFTEPADCFAGFDTGVLFKRTCGKLSVESIGRDTILKIRQLDLSGDREAELVRDMFMFGFYSQGMELVDIAHLTADSLRGTCLIYRKRLVGREIVVPLDPDAVRIVGRYKSTGSPYIFPFLYKGRRLSFASIRHQVQTEIKKIGRAIGFPGLTFSMNIAAYRNIMSRYPVSGLLEAGT